MKNTLLILTFIITSLIGFAQTDLINGSYELKGKIINHISLPPDCGYVAWGTVIEFEIIQFTNPNYKSKSIGVIFRCPESYGDDFFEIGKTYTMSVVENSQTNFSWNIPNKSILKKYNLNKELIVFKAEKE